MAEDKKSMLPSPSDIIPMMPAPAESPKECGSANGDCMPGRVKQQSWTPLGFLPGWAKWGINQAVKTTLILAAHGAWHSAAVDGNLSDFHMPASNFAQGKWAELAQGNLLEGDKLALVKGLGTTLNDMLVQPGAGHKNPSPFAATNGNYFIPRMREDKNAALGAFSPGNIMAKGWNLMAERAIPCAIYCAIFAAGPAGVPGAIGTFMVTSFMADAMEKVYKGLVAKPLGLA